MPKQDKIDRDEIEQEYGLAYALFKAFPELDGLLQQAVKQNWDANKFQVELRQTDWFRKHSDVWRQGQALKYADPATYRERLINSRTQVQNLAGAFDADLSKKALKRLSERALLFGWSEDQIRDNLAGYVRPGADGHYEGQLSSIEEQLRNTAMRNGVRVGKKQLRNWMRSIVRGNASQDQYQTYIRDVAAKTFSAYGDQIRGGMDLMDVASPYMQSMSEVLELNPASVDLYDKTIRRALSHRDADGNPTPMSVTDFEDSLRADKRWQYTDNARETMTGMAISLGQQFGLL